MPTNVAFQHLQILADKDSVRACNQQEAY